MSNDYIEVYKRREQILKEYAEELISKIEAITKLHIPSNIFIDIESFVKFLEEFIHSNRLFDTRRIWKKYEIDYLRTWKEAIEDLPANESINKLKNKIDEMVKKAGRGE